MCLLIFIAAHSNPDSSIIHFVMKIYISFIYGIVCMSYSLHVHMYSVQNMPSDISREINSNWHSNLAIHPSIRSFVRSIVHLFMCTYRTSNPRQDEQNSNSNRTTLYMTTIRFRWIQFNFNIIFWNLNEHWNVNNEKDDEHFNYSLFISG